MKGAVPVQSGIGKFRVDFVEHPDLDSRFVRKFINGHAHDVHVRPPPGFHHAFGDVQSFLIGEPSLNVFKRQQHGTIGITPQHGVRHKEKPGPVASIHRQNFMHAGRRHHVILFVEFQ